MSRQTIIDVAASQNGITESPPNSNKTKYGVWYGLNGEKWCAIFVSWVYAQANFPLGRIEGALGYQSCQGGYNYFKQQSALTNNPQKGDIVFYDWTGDGHCDHTGIFDTWADGIQQSFYAWEGNTSEGNNSDGGQVMRRLRRRALVKAFASPKVLDNPSQGIASDDVQKGDTGTSVTAIQKLLHDLNYHITVDGIFGDETETAIKQFQKDNNLQQTGIVTQVTLGLMEEKVLQPNVADKKFISGSYLRKGNAGAAVLDLQKALNAAGANPKVIEDGVFDADTTAAVKNFQQQKGINVDGVAGPDTFKFLNLFV